MGRKKGRLLWGVVTLALLGAAIWRFGVLNGARVLWLLEQAGKETSVSGTFLLRTPDGKDYQGTFGCRDWLGERFWGVTMGELTLYYYNETLYFDNGRGYDASCWRESLTLPDEKDALLLLLAGVERESDGERERFHLDLADYGTPLLSVSMETEEQRIFRVSLDLQGGYVLELIPEHPGGADIPVEILMETPEARPSANALEPLFRGCAALGQETDLTAEVTLTAQCGMLTLREEAAVFCTEQGIFFSRNGKDPALLTDSVTGIGDLALGLCWTVCKEGDAQSVEADTAYYTLRPESELLEELFVQLLPELEGLGITFTDSILTVTVSGNRVMGLTLECVGEIPFFATTIPVEMYGELRLGTQ